MKKNVQWVVVATKHIRYLLGLIFVISLTACVPHPQTALSDPTAKPVSKEEAVAIARSHLESLGIVYNPNRDVIIVLEKVLGEVPVWLVGYWIKSNPPAARAPTILADGRVLFPAEHPPFVPGGERNVYISKETGEVLKVEFTL